MLYSKILITGLTYNRNATEKQNNNSCAKQSTHETVVRLRIDSHRCRLPLPKPSLKLHLIQSKKIENLFFHLGLRLHSLCAVAIMKLIEKSILIGLWTILSLHSIGCSPHVSEKNTENEPTIPPLSPAIQQTLQSTNGMQIVKEEELSKTNGLWYLRGTTNLFSGMELDYHTNGVVKLQMTFTNGLPYGLNTVWHSNGNKQSEGKFLKGKRNGLWEMWFDNGKPDKAGNFVNGKPDGLQVFWHTNQVKSVEWEYKNGMPHGKMKRFHENGKLEQEGSYDMGMRTGEWFAWDENGKKVRTALFDQGKLIKENQIDKPKETSPKLK